VQYRTDYGPRRVQLKVVNDADAPVRVTGAVLSSPAFAGDAAAVREQTIPPGTARDLAVQLGAPVCDADPVATVALTLTDADGRAASGVLTPEDPLGWLARIHADDCLTAAFEDAATVTVGPVRVDRSGARPVALLTLRGAATGVGAASVPAVSRTILLRPATPDADAWTLGWTLDAGHPGASAEIALIPSNCNPHILAEDKRGTFWPLQVSLPDGTTGTVFAPSPDEVRAALYAFVAEYCGF
jgi:hypothetical protein